MPDHCHTHTAESWSSETRGPPRFLKIMSAGNEGRELNSRRSRKFKLDGFVDFFMSSGIVRAYYRLARQEEEQMIRQLGLAHAA